MRRWIISATAVMIAGAFACVEIVGVHDLTCEAPEGSPFDTCVGEGGINVLPTNGEIHGLVWVGATLVAVGSSIQDASPHFAVQVFSSDGTPSGDPILDIPDSEATSVTATFDSGIYAAGGNDKSIMLRHYAFDPFRADQPPGNLTQSSSYTKAFDGVPLRTAAAIVGSFVFGTTVDGRLIAMRYNNNGSPSPPDSTNHDAIFDSGIPFQATSGAVGSSTITILANGPDAGTGLTMVRWSTPNQNDNIDTTFNDGGALFTSFGNGGAARALVNVPSDPSYWVGGIDRDASGLVVTHVLVNGAIDKTWITSGASSGINAMIPVDGGLLAAGFANGHLAVARFTLDAGIDTTFGDAGVLEIPLPGQLEAIAQSDTRVVAGGYVTVNGTKQWVLVWLLP